MVKAQALAAPLGRGLGNVLRPAWRTCSRLVPVARRPELDEGGTTPYGFRLGFALYLLLALALLGWSLISPGGSFPGYGGDAEQYMWYLGWFWHAVLAGQNPFVTHLINFPRGMNLMWNTSIVAEAVLLGPLAAVIGTTATYNVWFLLDLVLAGLIGRAIWTRLGARQWLAIVGGLLTAAMPYTTTQALSHISLITTPLVLGLLLVLLKVVQDRPRRPYLHGILAGFLLAMQFYTLLEVLVSAVLVFLLTLVVAWFVARQDLRRWLDRLPFSFLLAAALTALIVAVPGLYGMFFGPYRVFSSVQPPNLYVVDLVSLILPTHAFLLHLPGPDPAIWFTGNFAEDNGYLGLPALLLLNWGLRRLWRRPLVRVLAITAGIVTLLALGHSLHLFGYPTPLPLPWAVAGLLPFVKDLLPARLMLYADLAVVGIVLLAMEDYLSRERPSVRQKPYWLFLLMIATWLPAIPYPNTWLPHASSDMQPTSAVAQALRGQPTYVLTVAFPEAMQMLQASGYNFPVANVYGHNDNSLARQQQLQGVQVLLNPDLAPEIYQTILLDDLMRLGVTRLYFLPRPSHNSSTIPEEALREINATLGPPIAASPSGGLVWRVQQTPLQPAAP